ncbi:MAG: RNA 3'-terminal phosphate cyclase, partial [bacterium]
MIILDGAAGEGGGQILRTALSLSALTGQPFEIKNIRANRPKPGLRAQHLKCVQAAGAICQARVSGDRLHSSRLTFSPGAIKAGNYHFEIGTAGSTSLVLQTIFYPISFAQQNSTISITGGTHVPWAPCFHYLQRQWLPFMQRLGFRAKLQMEQAGFYPKGRGKIIAEIKPIKSIQPLTLLTRGNLLSIHGVSAFANLPRSVAERQNQQIRRMLQNEIDGLELEILQMPAFGKNTLMLLLGKYEHSQCCYDALGAPGKPAENVAREAAQKLLAFFASGGVFDEYLADQILIPFALAEGRSAFETPKITRHLLTNIEVIKLFLATEIKV